MSVRYQFREQECVQITYDAGGDRIRMDEYTANQLQRSISYWGDGQLPTKGYSLKQAF